MKPKNELVRAVKSPEGEISLDYTGKKPGRGAYVCSNTECLKRIIKTNALSRALKANISDDIIKELNEVQNEETASKENTGES